MEQKEISATLSDRLNLVTIVSKFCASTDCDKNKIAIIYSTLAKKMKE